MTQPIIAALVMPPCPSPCPDHRLLELLFGGSQRTFLDFDWQVAGEAVEELRRHGGQQRFLQRDIITAFKGAVAGVRRLYLLQDLSEQGG